MKKVICKTECSTMMFDEENRRFYQEFEGFWNNSVDEITSEHAEFSRLLYEQRPGCITALLDFSKLKMTQPQIAEDVYPALKHFLKPKQVQAIAIIENPENIVVKLQAKRILELINSHDRRIMFFTDKRQAETWLDKDAPLIWTQRPYSQLLK